VKQFQGSEWRQATETRRLSLAAEEPVNGPTRDRIKDYLSRTGLNLSDFAYRIGYSHSALRFFIGNRYDQIAGTAKSLVGAANAFMDTHPVGAPMELTGELYPTTNVRVIRETFEALLPKPVAYMIYAPPGSQKSFVLKHQVQELNAQELSDQMGRRAFYLYARQNIRPRDMIRRVAVACGVRVTQEVDGMLNSIRFEFRHNRALLVIDEAQHLDIQCFETLRELLDEPPYFSLLFAGSHDLKKKFDEFSATLEQWNSRILDKVRLPGLEHDEARGIIDREIGELLAAKSSRERDRVANAMIASSTRPDAFEGNRTYINVRTLTNLLDQFKAHATGKRLHSNVEEIA
jgi:hypothetical protein